MEDYSDLLFLIGAIAIFMILATNANQAVLQNKQTLTSSEMDYGAISVAQNVVEKARWMTYSEATKEKLESINTNSLYDIKVSISDTTISQSNNQNKKINIQVTSPYMKNKDDHVTMCYIKTER